MDIRELLMHLQKGTSNRRIAEITGTDRRTVSKYKAWAEAHDLLSGKLPPLEELQALLVKTLPETKPPQTASTVEPYRKQVEAWVKEKVEVKAMHERLKEQGYTGSYMAVYRFVRRMKGNPMRAVVRVERPPGEEVQVDFGYAGRMIDPETGQLRRVWAFVMTLSWSRHQYVEFVFDQKVETWLKCHRHALEYFGGVPERVVIDNLKAAIVKAVRDDPAVQASYQECALHYGFRIWPCRVRTPEHKGKVEQGGVHYVKRNFLGGREATTITKANQDVLVWCETTAGLRRHGTTKEAPLLRFTETERERLQPLPKTPYDMPVWKELTLNRDCYVEFEGSYYSAPHRLVGQKLWLCAGLKQVRLFDRNYQLVGTHERAEKPGTRCTHDDHLPPEKVPGLRLNRKEAKQEAENIGPNVTEVVNRYLADPVIDRLPTVGRLLRLGERYGAARLEAACRRALAFDASDYSTIKRILKQGKENAPQTEAPVSPPASAFVRSPEELLGPALGAARWN